MLVEDDADLLANYEMALERAGYRVQSCMSAEPALAAAERQLPDLALIDIGLGHDSEAGFQLCQRLRAMSASLPIVFLTARDSEIDEISGLRLGADDYLSKAISLPQLLARINALLRRVEALREVPHDASSAAQLRVGELVLDVASLTVSWRGQRVDLGPGEFAMLRALAERPGQVKSRQQLMDAVGRTVDEQTITARIKRLRRSFTTIDPEFDAISTVYGVGYRWVVGGDS